MCLHIPVSFMVCRGTSFISVAMVNGKWKVARGLNSTPHHEIVLGSLSRAAGIHSNSQLCHSELASRHGRFTPCDRCPKRLAGPQVVGADAFRKRNLFPCRESIPNSSNAQPRYVTGRYACLCVGMVPFLRQP